MPMHENKWGTYTKSWGTTKDIAKVKPWPESSTKETTPISIISPQQPIDQISATTHTDQQTSSQK
jgi:hypothetical protein